MDIQLDNDTAYGYKDLVLATDLSLVDIFDTINAQNLTKALHKFSNYSSRRFTNSSKYLKFPTLPIDMQFNAGHIISISVYTTLCVLSAVGNITVLTAILRRRRNREFLLRIDLLLLNLAIADLMVTFFMMPLEIVWAVTVEWKGGDFLCRAMAFLRIFGLYLSGFLLVCLASDRYWAVRYPMQGIASTKRAKWMVLSSWILSGVCSFPQIIIFHVESHPVYTWYTQCVTYNIFPEPLYEFLYNIFVMVMMYALPLVLIVGLYGSIAVELWKKGISSRSTFGSEGGSRRNGTENIRRAKIKSIQMTFVIAAAFLICWSPYYFMCIWYWTDPESARNVDQRIQKGLFLFACANSTVNPIVYGLFHVRSIFGRRNIRVPQSMSMPSTNRISTTRLFICSVNNGQCNEAVKKASDITCVEMSGRNGHGLSNTAQGSTCISTENKSVTILAKNLSENRERRNSV